jgi:DNA-directed RNA polymerase subunit RPC12/RpoP
MPNSTFYVQGCPTCGRRLQIRVEYLGRRVVCQHCQGQFTAADPANRRCDGPEFGSELLRRADELLESVAQQRAAARGVHPR